MLVFILFILIMVIKMYYLNLFFVYSIFGFILESILVQFWNSVFNSGILFGPWTPVYGVGVIVISLIHKWLDKYVKNSILKGVLLFFLSAFILSLIEWSAGMLIEVVFNKVYWSYETMKYNFGHYVTLEIAAIWGIMSIVFMYLIKPLFDKIVKKIPKWLTRVLTILFIIDFLLTLIIK